MKDNKKRTTKDLNKISSENLNDSMADENSISAMKLIAVTTYFSNILLLFTRLSLTVR